jgi:hypothetical protein
VRYKKKGFKKEADLAAALVDYHEREGWDVYEEIAPSGGGSKRADIVCVKGEVIRVIECKMNMHFGLLNQGGKWRGYAEEVYVAVPALYRHWKVKGETDLAIRCATELLGIGVIEVLNVWNKDPEVHFSLPEAFPATVPRYRKALASLLIPEVKEYNAKAGTAGGKFWTPFKGTCQKLLALIETHPSGLSVKDAVAKVEHHYRNDKSAQGNITKLAERGVIPGVSLEKRGRTNFLVPSPQ